MIIECFDAIAEAIKTGRPYTMLDRQPVDPQVAHEANDGVSLKDGVVK